MTTSEVQIKSETAERALGQLKDASLDVKRLAMAIERDMGQMVADITGGMHTRPQNHQHPFDLQTALAKRDAAVERALSCGATVEQVQEASKGLGAW